jgi:hypothetical protein
MLVPELPADLGDVEMVSASSLTELAKEELARGACLAPVLVPDPLQRPDATLRVAHGLDSDEEVNDRLRA